MQQPPIEPPDPDLDLGDALYGTFPRFLRLGVAFPREDPFPFMVKEQISGV
jgi:hypothetical protein